MTTDNLSKYREIPELIRQKAGGYKRPKRVSEQLRSGAIIAIKAAGVIAAPFLLWAFFDLAFYAWDYEETLALLNYYQELNALRK